MKTPRILSFAVLLALAAARAFAAADPYNLGKTADGRTIVSEDAAGPLPDNSCRLGAPGCMPAEAVLDEAGAMDATTEGILMRGLSVADSPWNRPASGTRANAAGAPNAPAEQTESADSAPAPKARAAGADCAQWGGGLSCTGRGAVRMSAAAAPPPDDGVDFAGIGSRIVNPGARGAEVPASGAAPAASARAFAKRTDFSNKPTQRIEDTSEDPKTNFGTLVREAAKSTDDPKLSPGDAGLQPLGTRAS
jgi:hypothetical protein